MNVKFMKVLSLILAVLMLIVATGCVNPENLPSDTTANGDVTTVDNSETTAPIVSEFSIAGDYNIVRPEKMADDLTIKAAQLIRETLGKLYPERTFDLKTDWKKPADEVVPFEYEILIGPTNRKESEALYDEMTVFDYKYKICSPNVIVIYGEDGESIYHAVEKFLYDTFGFIDGKAAGAPAVLKVGAEFTYKHDYNVKSLKFNNIDAKDFSIVALSTTNAAPKALSLAIEQLCGVSIPIVKNTEFTGENAIFVGIGGVDGKALHNDYGSYEFLVYSDGGGKIAIDCTQSLQAKAVSEFILKYLTVENENSYNVAIPAGETRGYTFSDELNGVTFVSQTTETVAPGVVHNVRTYKDKDGKPVKAYVLTIQPGAATLITGTPKDGTQTTGVSATVLAQMNSAVANGKNVIAGVNADFFDMGGTNAPRGLCVKDGKLLTPAGDRAWFGVLKDGTAVIGAPAEYSKYASQLYTAVGGRQIMLKKGIINDICYGDAFGYTRHPRTAVGIKADGTLVLIVVDGRHEEISNGASLADLAVMMKELGCVEALNLDGGGSSTFICKNSAGAFKTRNYPSDSGYLRSIYDSLLVVLK